MPKLFFKTFIIDVEGRSGRQPPPAGEDEELLPLSWQQVAPATIPDPSWEEKTTLTSNPSGC